ncbi:hypothetical protein KSP39_PZI013254 [Platanthera zijinensis]|uniref:Integrase catalytic domain-containing protein n=1 Tax=Platanthera zijinensis TaxID=2320716 RepID=A0AAP0G400_9ASPA
MESTSGSGSDQMVKLNGANYHQWHLLMEDLIYVKGWHAPIFEEMPKDTDPAKWKVEHRKLCGFIRRFVEPNVYNHVASINDAKDLWKTLETLYAKSTGINKLYLLKKLGEFRYREGSPILDHVNEFQGIIDRLTAMKVTFEDEVNALWLLKSLPDSWEMVRVSLINSSPQGIVSMEIAKSGILNEEVRRKSQGTSGSSSRADVLFTETRGRGRSKSRGRKEDRSQSRGKSKTRYQNVECHYCHKKGHIKKFCYTLKNDQKKKGIATEGKDEGHTAATVSTEEDDVIIVGDDVTAALSCDDRCWIVDSGASAHVSHNRELFATYTTHDCGVLRMGNGDTSKVLGRGDMHLKTSTGALLVLRDVRHVPDIRFNLISVGRLGDEGHLSVFGGDFWKLIRGSLVMARGYRDSGLYYMEGRPEAAQANSVRDETSTSLWHRRLAHISQKGLGCLAKKKLISDISDVHLERCDHCMAGKQNRVSFHSHTSTRRSEPLELVHTDVCGPLKVQTRGGASYFVTFIDDHSRKLWVYAIKTKDQVLDTFRRFHAEVERQSGKRLKCIRSDNGGEYIGPFDEYCRDHGIRHEKTPPKTPQLNGVAERMNRTLMERIQCMLSESKLPGMFWGEALLTTAHVINLSPSSALQEDVPDRVWCGKDPSYSHLRVFGCKAFVHVPRDERSKLDSKTRQCIFLGYGYSGEFGYRFFDPVEKKLVRSRDAVFCEDQTIGDPEGTVELEVDSRTVAESPMIGADDAEETVELAPAHGVDILPDNDITTDGDPGVAEDITDDVPAPAPEPALRRSDRARHPPARYSASEFVLLTDAGEPESYDEAVKSTEKRQWMDAMQDEMQSLQKNHTYDLVRLPKGKKALKNRWIFRVKQGDSSTPPRYKARLVVKGFGQRQGVDFDEIFSPVVKMSSIRVVLGLAARLDLEVEQMDVKTAFLHGDLEEELYMEQPEGFSVRGKEGLVCRLQKSLYGLKQAPRQWYRKFDSFMGEINFRRTTLDHCVFIKQYASEDFIILLLYVDDMLIVGRNTARIAELKRQLSSTFEMKDLGAAKTILGMHIRRDRGARLLWLSQERYIRKVLQRFDMDQAKKVSVPLAAHFRLTADQCPSTPEEIEAMQKVPYASAVGSLMYAMVCTRPDIAHAVGTVSRFLSNPGREHWSAVKWILRYLQGTSDLTLRFGDSEPELLGYTDADMAGDVDSRRSTSGYMILFTGGAVSWASRLQKCVALSTTEAEFIAVTEAGKELLWMKRFIKELGFTQDRYTLLCDSQSAIHLGKNPTFHSRSKHIDTRYHWIRDVLEQKELDLQKVHTDDNGADMLTKTVPRGKFEHCVRIVGMAVLST